MANTTITKNTRVFKNGNSQAVRIPSEFKFDDIENIKLEIYRNEDGDLVIHEKRKGNLYDKVKNLLAAMPEDFGDVMEEVIKNQKSPQEREPL